MAMAPKGKTKRPQERGLVLAMDFDAAMRRAIRVKPEPLTPKRTKRTK
jgi:hypothetical protein